MTEAIKPLLSPVALAELLSVTPLTITNWRKAGCPHTVLGPKLYRFDYDEVMAWCAQRATKGKAA